MKNERHFFAGAMTASGFCNFFEFINDYNKKGMLYIIKGGSGTGKSSLMKKVGAHFLQKGEEIEFFHCSADPDSLDAIRLKKYNIAIVDGTAPHVTEMKMPAIKDCIIDVSQFIKPEVAKYEKQIEKAMLAKSNYYKQAINALSLAKKEHFKIEKCYSKNMDFDKLNILTENLIKKIESARTTF